MDKSKLKLPSLTRKFIINDEYRDRMKKDCCPITKENLMSVMSTQTEKTAQYIVDYERLVKEYRAAKRNYDVTYHLIYDFLKFDPSVDIVYYDPKRDRNDSLLVQAVEADDDVQSSKKLMDELEAETKMMEEFLKAYGQRSWACKNIIDLMKFQSGSFE